MKHSKFVVEVLQEDDDNIETITLKLSDCSCWDECNAKKSENIKEQINKIKARNKKRQKK